MKSDTNNINDPEQQIPVDLDTESTETTESVVTTVTESIMGVFDYIGYLIHKYVW